jgi:hypothetical protein
MFRKRHVSGQGKETHPNVPDTYTAISSCTCQPPEAAFLPILSTVIVHGRTPADAVYTSLVSITDRMDLFPLIRL